MPTNYNFVGSNDIFNRKYPNVSSAIGFKQYGENSTFTSGTYTISSQRSPLGSPSCSVVIPTFTSSTYITSINPTTSPKPFTRLSNALSFCTSPRVYNISFYVKGITYPAGTLIRGQMDFRDSDSNGYGPTIESPDVNLDGSWQYVSYKTTINAGSAVIADTVTLGKPYNFAFLSISLIATGGPYLNTEILIADVQVLDSSLSERRSFDNQFIPADTFRQGNLFLSGNASSGQLGNNSNINRSSLVQEFTKSSNWKDISIGFYHANAIKSDGTLWSWGDNITGQLGVNGGADRRTPVQEFTSSNNWIMVSSGGGTTNGSACAIKSDGTLWCWGSCTWGELGIGVTNTSRLTPVQEFTSSSNWKSVSVGDRIVAAIKNDGTLWEWGFTRLVRWVNPGVIYSPSPVQEFTSGTNWKKVCAGDYGLKSDGTLWGWGDGTNKPSPNGFALNVIHSSPLRIGGANDLWRDVAENPDSTGHAIKTDGTLWSWGRGDGGEMGNNTASINNFNIIREATSSTNWAKVFGGECVAAIKTDGTLWCWGGGFGYNGALGLGNLTRYSSPVQHPSNIRNWKKMDFDGSNADFGAFLTYIDPII